MRPPCEIVQRDFLRAVRASVAWSLKKEGFSQTEISSKMGLTQAAVSKYLSQPLTKTRLAGEIDHLSKKLTEMIKTNESNTDKIVLEICSTCMHSRLGSTLCEMHQDKVPSLRVANCQVCTQILGGRDDNLAERAIVIGDIFEALRTIEQSESFQIIVPQVRANFVVCNKNAQTVKDVAGVPGRITIIDGHARALISPQFGASQHTAELLLHAKSTWHRVRACLCVSGRNEVVKLASKYGFQVVSMEEPESSASKIIMSLKKTNKIPGQRTAFPAIHIPGGIGVEPILYLFGPSAKELGERSLRISDSIMA
jgi:predicted fused transcriptional regulator/phosphomethylpyrimidine kinase/predicted transcriptional regulator